MAIKNAVQTYPLGYLALLNAKIAGVTPQDLPSELGPTLDMYEFFAAQLGLTSSSADNLAQTVAGSGATVTVPIGEAWDVLMAQASAANGTAGDAIQMHVRASPANSGLPSVILATAAGTLATAAPGVHALFNPRSGPFIVPPGTRFVAQLGGTAANAVDLTCRVLYRPLGV